jgi:hypothetical protein
MSVLNLILGIIGTVFGCAGTIMSIQARRQHLAIGPSDKWTHGYKITNHSLRPIPIEKVTLLVRHGSSFEPTSEPPVIHGLNLPASLSPESSFEVDWASIDQLVDLTLGEEMMLVVQTQTGKQIRSRRTKLRKSQQNTGGDK